MRYINLRFTLLTYLLIHVCRQPVCHYAALLPNGIETELSHFLYLAIMLVS